MCRGGGGGCKRQMLKDMNTMNRLAEIHDRIQRFAPKSAYDPGNLIQLAHIVESVVDKLRCVEEAAERAALEAACRAIEKE
jgi:hypothetical protein